MNIVILFVLFCVGNGERDRVNAVMSIAGCEDLVSSATTNKTSRKARDKCKEYQETLVYPCEPSSSPNGGRSRANHCRINKTELTLGGDPPVPHMAMLGFGEPLYRVGWLCGAVLLSEKYILAPANCKDLFGDIRVSYAKIGVQQLNDSSQDKIFKVKSVTTHPEYRPGIRYNDIALFELQDPVPLSPDVMPACLPVDDNLQDDKVLFSYWDAKTTFRKRIRNKLSHEECSNKFPPSEDLERGVDSTTQICYEDKKYSEMGNCLDTLGGPLQVLNTDIGCMYTLIGIAAFSQTCSYEVYAFTKVAPYVSWIESVVWPSDSKPVIASKTEVSTKSRTEVSTKIENNFGSSIHWNRDSLVFLILSWQLLFYLL